MGGEVGMEELSSFITNSARQFGVDRPLRSNSREVSKRWIWPPTQAWTPQKKAEPPSSQASSLTTRTNATPNDDSEPAAAVVEAPAEATPPVPAMTECASTSSRRELLDERLRNFRQEKLKRKASADAQLLAHSNEELVMKRQLLHDLRKSEATHKKTMDSLTANISRMTETMSAGFNMLQHLMAMPSQPASSSSMMAHQQVNAMPFPQHGQRFYQGPHSYSFGGSGAHSRPESPSDSDFGSPYSHF